MCISAIIIGDASFIAIVLAGLDLGARSRTLARLDDKAGYADARWILELRLPVFLWKRTRRRLETRAVEFLPRNLLRNIRGKS